MAGESRLAKMDPSATQKHEPEAGWGVSVPLVLPLPL